MSVAFLESDPLRKIFIGSARALERVYRTISRDDPDSLTRAARWLQGDRWFIQAQMEELDTTLTAKLCRKLVHPQEGKAEAEPSIYGAISNTFNCLLSSPVGLHSLGKMLTTPALAELLSPERLGTSLGTAELAAVPSLVKLVLVERLARCASSGPLDSDQCGVEVCSAIECLHALARIRWQTVVELISPVHRILSQDPSGTYAKMDIESRASYRRAVATLAQESGNTEEHVARCAVTLAWQASLTAEGSAQCDAGFYLIGAGIAQLRHYGNIRAALSTRIREAVLRAPNAVYIGGIFLLTAVLTFAFARFAQPLSPWWFALLILPASAPAVAFVNSVLNVALTRRRMPRLDFSAGIPPEHRTCVVIPTLLLSRHGVERMLERLEVHYLANSGPNLVFALLTDFPDAASPSANNTSLLESCSRGIQRLNHRYATSGRAPFYLLHRKSCWNPQQNVWMGRERKRGKLEDLNRFLLGLGDPFQAKVGDLSALGDIRYVITLDADTQLPRDAAWKLVGTLAHPLQRPVVDPDSNTVTQGYAILQPLVKTDIESASKSRFAAIFAGQTGLDPYTSAIADVYHDLYGRASFSGKGIYDLRTVHAVLDGRFRDNILLSHDLIEGEHARVGLVTDVDVIEDYPNSEEAWLRRRHRWIRGDWQTLEWLFSRVRGPRGERVANPLPLVSRWKIADNLRRSLLEINLLILLAAIWLFVPAAAPRLSLGALVILASGAYVDLIVVLFQPHAISSWWYDFRERARQFWRAHQEALLGLIFLPQQAFVAADAIVRTLVRCFITRRNLLEWESMAQVEAGGVQGWRLPNVFFPAAIAVSVFCVALLRHAPLQIPFLLMVLWLGSPLVARFLRSAPRRQAVQSASDVEFLHDISLRTWRYFADFARVESYWLVPDNVQEDPETIAHRASPTNIGLQLASYVAAFDFGYITHQELADNLNDVLATLARLDRYHGHFFNWYDTETLTPLPPRYVSTVDSGNLAAALIAVKQACEGIAKQPIITASVLDGMRDHCARVRRSLPPAARRTPALRMLAALARQLAERPKDLFSWHRILHDVSAQVDEIDRVLTSLTKESSGSHKAHPDELSYWRLALIRRVRAAQVGLRQLAPWLSSPYSRALEKWADEPRYEDLFAELTRTPALDELASTYDAIEKEIAEILFSADRATSESGTSATALAGPPQDIEPGLLRQLYEDVQRARRNAQSLLDGFNENSSTSARFIRSMDFTFLFDADRELLRIGYSTQTSKLDDSYYDLLASEARTAVFFAVAKGDVPRETWFRLSRKVTAFRGHRTLVSWSGTMFEYLMPSIFMKTFAPSLLGESLSGVVQVQKAYAQERNVPWGISESSCSSRGLDLHYDYRAFGIPAVSISSDKPTSLVVAPYASMLALMIDKEPAVKNLRRMASRGWTGRYGFYDAVDFPSPEALLRQNGTIVRSFMAHHVGMGFLALCNALLGNPMQKRFHSEPMVAATELLLQERIPAVFAVAEEAKTEALGI